MMMMMMVVVDMLVLRMMVVDFIVFMMIMVVPLLLMILRWVLLASGNSMQYDSSQDALACMSIFSKTRNSARLHEQNNKILLANLANVAGLAKIANLHIVCLVYASKFPAQLIWSNILGFLSSDIWFALKSLWLSTFYWFNIREMHLVPSPTFCQPNIEGGGDSQASWENLSHFKSYYLLTCSNLHPTHNLESQSCIQTSSHVFVTFTIDYLMTIVIQLKGFFFIFSLSMRKAWIHIDIFQLTPFVPKKAQLSSCNSN